ncbi:hypothetical protein SDC9_164930 [bioreactor metagenome]|uniref:Uncharacterized protein n=1 Tax=bioreactor metagenome TaxID=1076179 RepID=A0A645FSY9_9ZZZZ
MLHLALVLAAGLCAVRFAAALAAGSLRHRFNDVAAVDTHGDSGL